MCEKLDYPSAKYLATLPNYVVLVGFSDNKFKTFDLKQLFDEIPAFRMLEQIPDLYEKAHLDGLGLGIEWNKDLDLDIGCIYHYGIDYPTPSDHDIQGKTKALVEKYVQYRKKTTFSQRALGYLVKMAQANVARVELGKDIPRLNTMLRLLEPLGYTLAVVPIKDND